MQKSLEDSLLNTANKMMLEERFKVGKTCPSDIRCLYLLQKVLSNRKCQIEDEEYKVVSEEFLTNQIRNID